MTPVWFVWSLCGGPVNFMWKVQCCISKFFLHSAANRELNLLFSGERDYSTVWIIDGELNAAELEFCLEVEYLKMSVNNPVLENHHF